MLTIEKLNQHYGSSHTLRDVSFEVPKGQVVGLLGRNGVGKSTLLKCLMGVVPVTSGSISIDGQEITNLPPFVRVRLGLGYVPQGREIFPRLTVEENLLMGAYTRTDATAVKRDLARVYELFQRLRERRRQTGGTLSGGEQQMLAIGRALMGKPKVLLLDEPSMGISPVLTERIYETIEQINKDGMTILLVEQNANFALDVSKRAYVLETGKVSLSDTSDALRTNPDVQKAYLGT